MNVTPLAILHVKANVPLIKLQFNDLKGLIPMAPKVWLWPMEQIYI